MKRLTKAEKNRLRAKRRRRWFEKSGGVCILCGKPFSEGEKNMFKKYLNMMETNQRIGHELGNRVPLDRDHFIPKKLGGQTTSDNIHIVHKECNRKKSHQLWM